MGAPADDALEYDVLLAEYRLLKAKSEKLTARNLPLRQAYEEVCAMHMRYAPRHVQNGEAEDAANRRAYDRLKASGALKDGYWVVVAEEKLFGQTTEAGVALRMLRECDSRCLLLCVGSEDAAIGNG